MSVREIVGKIFSFEGFEKSELKLRLLKNGSLFFNSLKKLFNFEIFFQHAGGFPIIVKESSLPTFHNHRIGFPSNQRIGCYKYSLVD